MGKSEYVKLAEKVIYQYITSGEVPHIEIENNSFMEKKACFVSIHLKNKQLRGCIGTIYPYRENLYEEIVHNAIAASTEDPRFLPIKENELDNLEINVDVLSEPKLISSLSELNCKKYGIIVSDGYRKGVLLPDLEGVNTIEDQIQIAKSKAGIDQRNNRVDIYKFTVNRYF